MTELWCATGGLIAGVLLGAGGFFFGLKVGLRLKGDNAPLFGNIKPAKIEQDRT